jgi:hypothetical protein
VLTLKIASEEVFDENTSEFLPTQTFTLRLEHSLVSLSKWESKFVKPFLGTDKTPDEMLWYVAAMDLSDDNLEVYQHLNASHVEKINKYISAPMTATTFTELKKPTNRRETVTSELIYYWMVTLNIPFECQHWHLNRLLTLIRVCNIKNTPPKKMSANDIATQNRMLNEQRRKAANSRG